MHRTDGSPVALRSPWGQMAPAARQLILTRGLRSVAQGAMTVDFALYLKALGWSGVGIGALLTGGGLVGGLLGLVVGPLSDRSGRRPFLLFYQAMLVVASVVAVLTARGPVLAAAAVASSFGRGQGGGAGPFAPAEQAWLAAFVPARERGRVFSLNGAVSFWGMGVGSLLAGLVPLLAPVLPGALEYRPLFALSALVAAVNLLQIRAIPEVRSSGDRPVRDPAVALRVRAAENQAIWKLALVNTVNALAIGLTGPLITYWFAIRFHVGPAAIGPVLGLTFLLTGFASVLTGRIAVNLGIVRSVVWVRLGGVILLLMLPLMPTYALAALVYVLRSALNRGSVGARQALSVSLTGPERQGFASSVNAASMRLPSSVGPMIAGYLFTAGALDVPFYAGALLQLLYVVLFHRVMGRYDPGGDRAAA